MWQRFINASPSCSGWRWEPQTPIPNPVVVYTALFTYLHGGVSTEEGPSSTEHHLKSGLKLSGITAILCAII